MLIKEQCAVCGRKISRWWYLADEPVCRWCKIEATGTTDWTKEGEGNDTSHDDHSEGRQS